MTMSTVVKRLTAVEARVGDVEDAHARTLYAMERRLIRVELAMGRIVEHMGLPATTDAEVEAVLERAYGEDSEEP